MDRPLPPAVSARADTLRALSHERFDVLVIGGGIAGAGVAREAALAGLRTALIERDDFASGTSSRSSRLVHGGVRYLEHGHLGLVFESSRERRLLLQLAPHLVRPLAFTWPVYAGARVPQWKVRAGLLLYDALALFRNVHAHEGLSADAVLEQEPALAREGLEGGARYWDAATDDTRLTLATALAAREEGAVVVNHCAVTGALHDGEQLAGVELTDRLTGSVFPVQARVVVNATGPWSDATSRLTGGSRDHAAPQIMGSAGAHLAVPRQRLGNRDAVTVVSPLDGRVMFVIPAGPHAIIGTTERPAHHGPDEIRATEGDVTYLLQSVNRIFPHAALSPDDVISAWCGIRPLAAARAGEHSANAASREHAITQRADGLISVTGGKLTTYRAMAADVFRAASRALGDISTTRLHAPDPSDATPLPGGDLPSLDEAMREVRTVTPDAAVAERLVHAYGSRWRDVWQYAERDPALGVRLAEPLPYLLAEVIHAAERELACTLSDVLIRRTHVAFETRDHGRAAAHRIAPLLQAVMGWSDEERVQQLAAYAADVMRLFTIDPL
jgi:glycerol-3-phosphate dehydrogenase